MRLRLLHKINPNLHKVLSFYYHLYIPRFVFQLFNKPSGILVYVGVNTGESLVKIFYRYKKVYAFEANPVLADLLTKRFSVNTKTSVSIINCAVGEKDGLLDFNIYDKTNNFANSSLAKLDKRSEIKKIQVRTINLRNFLISNEINFIEHYISDIEGFDLTVLTTLKEYIDQRKIGKIQCEVVVDGIENPYLNIENYEGLFDKLLDQKYEKVASGWGNLEAGSHAQIAGYRFRDVMWQPK